MLDAILTTGILAATLRIATPLLLASLGGAVCLEAGVFNIALEGLMLSGAFLAVVLSGGSLSAGTVIALTVLLTMVVASVFGFVTVTLRADPIIAGLGLNVVVLGLTSWMLRSVFGAPGGSLERRLQGLPSFEIGALRDVPVLSGIFTGHDILTYGAWVLAAGVYLFVHRSRFGLRLRATGEHPEAATTAGIRTVVWQYVAVLSSGGLCGLAGVALSLSHLGIFSEGMTAGRGFIAFAAAAFAGGNIPGTVGATLLFAFFGSLAIRFEGLGLPSHLVQMIPYLVTLGALIGASRRSPARSAGI
jgi:general nucleoside transport system permease protein